MLSLPESLIADIPRLSADEQRFIRRIMDRVLVQGRASYSPWVAANDARDLSEEAAQEALDLAVYVAMDSVKRADARFGRRLAERHDEAFAKVDEAMTGLLDDDGQDAAGEVGR